MNKYRYFDSAAQYPMLPCAMETYIKYAEIVGNPSSEHEMGKAARNALELARREIANLLHCSESEIYFTSGSTEACNLAVSCMANECVKLERSPYEHHAVSEPLDSYVPYRNNPCSVGYAQQLANNETGEIFLMPKGYNRILCDATAALGHMKISLSKLDVSYLVGGAHKFGGGLGAGFLYANKETEVVPMILGGGQERGMRSGTENVPAICAMATALEWQIEHMEENTTRLTGMRDMLERELLKIDGAVLNSPLHTRNCLPHILNISFLGVDAHALVLLLSKQEVMVSAGAACSNGLNEPSHVIMAMYNDEARARSAIRISLSHENTMGECTYAILAITKAVNHLRGIS